MREEEGLSAWDEVIIPPPRAYKLDEDQGLSEPSCLIQ